MRSGEYTEVHVRECVHSVVPGPDRTCELLIDAVKVVGEIVTRRQRRAETARRETDIARRGGDRDRR